MPPVDSTERANLKKGFDCSSRHSQPCLFDLSLFSLYCHHNIHQYLLIHIPFSSLYISLLHLLMYKKEFV